MYKITTGGNFYMWGKIFATGAEAKAYAENLVKAHRTFDVYKDGELYATGDDTGIYLIRKARSRITGSVGYAQLMSEKR